MPEANDKEASRGFFDLILFKAYIHLQISS